MPYFEEYEEGRIERFGAYRVTREDVIEFASKFDPQPFHLDDAAAAASPIFGRLAASGWHTCAIVMRMLTDEWTDAEGYFSLGGTGVDELRWTRPVYPGDTITIEVKRKEALGGFTMMSGQVKCGDKRVLSVDFTVAWKTPDGAPSA